MTKQFVPLFKNQSRSVTIETDATIGATVGTNLYWANGAVVTEAELRSTSSGGNFTLNVAMAYFVPITRAINTTAPLAGGGNLSADLTLTTSMATDRLIGRDTVGTGIMEQLTVGGGMEFTGSGGVQTSAFTGDVTKTAGGTVQTIPNDTVTFAKFQNITTARLLGRYTAGSGDMEEVILGTNLSFTGGTLNAAGSTSPLTTKGDLYTFTSVDARLAVGSAGESLRPESSTSTGLRYERIPYDTRYEWGHFDHFLGKPPTSTTAEAGASYDWTLAGLTVGTTVAQLDGGNTAPGVWRLDTGVVVAGGPTLRLGALANISLGAGGFRMSFRFRVPTLSDATNSFAIAMGLRTPGNANLLEIGYAHGTNSGKFYLSSIVAAGAPVVTNGTTTAVAGTWYRGDVIVNAAASSADFYINGNLEGTNSTNIPTAAMLGSIIMSKAAGTTARQLDMDFFEIYQRWTTAQ